MLDYSEEGYKDRVEYTRSLAGIIRSVIYFTSTEAAGLNFLTLNEDDSPYYVDSHGLINKQVRSHEEQLK